MKKCLDNKMKKISNAYGHRYSKNVSFSFDEGKKREEVLRWKQTSFPDRKRTNDIWKGFECSRFGSQILILDCEVLVEMEIESILNKYWMW